MTLEEGGHNVATENSNGQLEGSSSENIKDSSLVSKGGASGFAQSSTYEKRQSEDEDKFYPVEDDISKSNNDERRSNKSNFSDDNESSKNLEKQDEPTSSAKDMHASGTTEDVNSPSLSSKQENVSSNDEDIKVQHNKLLISDSENIRESEPQVFNEEKPSTGEETRVRSSSRENLSEPNHKENASQSDASSSKNTTEDEWQDMTALAEYDIYDDYGRLVARGSAVEQAEAQGYNNLGGAAKGYTRVQIDEDAQSATSMDDNTAYLFKEAGKDLMDDDEEARNPMEQMQATKDLLTDGQRIAYVGITRLATVEMIDELNQLERTKKTKKEVDMAVESMRTWSLEIMVRLHGHMNISSAEQVMIEQLAEHGVRPSDMTPSLKLNARIDAGTANASVKHSISPSNSKPSSPSCNGNTDISPKDVHDADEPSNQPEAKASHNDGSDISKGTVSTEMSKSEKLDIDIRWTILCDLFLMLIAASTYDSRSRRLLEKVGSYLDVPWIEICRFEKRVTDALEMQGEAEKETWDEDQHMQTREKLSKNRRLMMMGLATVGGGLVIGLSAGLLAPVIGAGLAAGFTTIGVAGTSSFLAGAGGAAIITSAAVVSGGTIAVRASSRRLGAVKTFEYRPLHNNKRVNLIISVAGWMTGKVDDVRLPFSTVDPIMGDLYSIHWEPEMLQSIGNTIKVLATEALTQGLQQILGSTILVALMASLQLPIVLTKLSYLIDNPWSSSLARADQAGLILADSLIDQNLGVRPVTLVGFSLGSRLIFTCLKELAARGAHGLIQNVYLFGSPIVYNKDFYLKAKSVVSGRFVNGYAMNDWILGYLFRATGGGIMRVAGLAPVELPGIENFNVTELVPGHMTYRQKMPRLLREVGWIVESDEFTEIEDPDPENHEARQRELINEIEEARKQLEKKPEKKRFNFFRAKKLEKKDWEMYDERSNRPTAEDEANDNESKDAKIMFDIDAIQSEAAELAAAGINIKQLDSTLPPIRLDTSSVSRKASFSSSPVSRDKSLDGVRTTRSTSFTVTPVTSETEGLPAASSNDVGLSDNVTSLPERGRSSFQFAVSAPVGNDDIERNAWAEDDDNLQPQGEMKMTFE